MTTVVPAEAAPAAASNPSLDLVDLALQAAEAYERPDVGARLQQTRRRLVDPDVRVLVVGEFKQGKSALINALVGAEICPVDDDVATAVTTVVRYGTGEPSVTVVHRDGSGGRHGARPDRTTVPLSDIAQYVSEAGNRGNHRDVSHVEVSLRRRILSKGLVLVDTPGVGGLGSAHSAVTLGALPTADAVLVVSDAGSEYTAPEMRFLTRASAMCPVVACVISKTDIHPHWRRVAQIDRSHLDRARLRPPMLPTSSVMRETANRTNDLALQTESGFTALATFLSEQVVKKADVLDRQLAAHDVGASVELMATPMRAELAALTDPARARDLVATLTEAKRRADELKKTSARWQTTLNDGIADLQSDIEHDLRDRMRGLGREAEEWLDEDDPIKVWDELADWLHERVVDEASTNVAWSGERAAHLAGQVADHFAAAGRATLPDLRRVRRGGAPEVADRVDPILRPDLSRYRFGQKLFTGMRGGYGGMLMVGMATSIAGLGLINPFSAVAGLVFAGHGLREERKQLLLRRRGDAKNAVRRHVDDVIFQLGKDSRDSVRAVQRALRDHFQETASELTTSTAEAVAAAQQAASKATTESAGRVKDLEAEIGRLDAVARQARELVAGETAR